VLVYNDRHWQRFLEAIGEPERFTQDARFANQAARSRHIHEVYGFVGEVMRTRTTAAWIELLERIDIPHQVPNTMEDLLADPHLRATGLLARQEHPSEGPMRVLGSPVRFGPQEELAPAPRLGEHSSEVLRAAGLSGEQVEALLAGGASVQG
jgi:crotonobetainyl-CoA:carnitine CoA-transferase CaiB-like acyl-CoA transferase